MQPPLPHRANEHLEEPGGEHQNHRLHQERPRVEDVERTGEHEGQRQQAPRSRQSELPQEQPDRRQRQIEAGQGDGARRLKMGQMGGPAQQHDTPLVNREFHGYGPRLPEQRRRIGNREVVLRVDVIGDQRGMRLAEFMARQEAGAPIKGGKNDVREQRRTKKHDEGGVLASRVRGWSHARQAGSAAGGT